MTDSLGPRFSIRPASGDDVPTILAFVRALAEYERLADHVVATEETLARSLFGARSHAECLMAECDGRSVGVAVYFHNFSTFTGRPGLYLEDIFVAPEYRGQGAGLALFRALARIARDRDCARLEWSVLDWNEPAFAFYRALGAEPLSDWTILRLTRAQIEKLAEG